jgi:hypothetical protein
MTSDWTRADLFLDSDAIRSVNNRKSAPHRRLVLARMKHVQAEDVRCTGPWLRYQGTYGTLLGTHIYGIYQADRHIGDKAKRMLEPSITRGALKVGSFDRRIERGQSFARSDTKPVAVPISISVNIADWLLE